MEQHQLAYLTTKYGVRQLITQWLTSILAAIEHFSPLDAQVALFGKVLRNEVEEEFEEAQQRVKATAHSLLQSILQVHVVDVTYLCSQQSWQSSLLQMYIPS